MTLTFNSDATNEIKTLARLRGISPTDKALMAAMVSGLVVEEVDRFAKPSKPPAEKVGAP